MYKRPSGGSSIFLNPGREVTKIYWIMENFVYLCNHNTVWTDLSACNHLKKC